MNRASRLHIQANLGVWGCLALVFLLLLLGSVRPAQAQIALQQVETSPGKVVCVFSEAVNAYNSFTLQEPARVVLDVSGAKLQMQQQRFSLAGGFSRLRIGNYEQKLRMVLDAANSQIPDYQVQRQGSRLMISWTVADPPAGQTKAEASSKDSASESRSPEQRPAGNMRVTDLAFDVKGGETRFTVTASENVQGKVKKLTSHGAQTVSFGIEGAYLNPSLRRTLDATAMPSSVRFITPYVRSSAAGKVAMFYVRLKEAQESHLEVQGPKVVFHVANGAYSQNMPEGEATQSVDVSADAGRPAETSARPDDRATSSQGGDAAGAPAELKDSSTPDKELARRLGGDTLVVANPKLRQLMEEEEKKYTGEPVNLVFDNAEINKIFQLLAEVGDMNIVLSPQVSGTITLRLRDVPWDQALDIVLEMQDLAIVERGNVIRIMPRQEKLQRQQERLDAIEELQDREQTQTAVIEVSYTDLANVSDAVKDILSDEGTITEDPRNKKLIVNDVPSKLQEAQDLVNILDTPEKQVLIEARIVEANVSSGRNLGVNWGYTYDDVTEDSNWDVEDAQIGVGGSFVINPSAPTSGTGAGIGSAFRFGRIGIDNSILDLRISALETANEAKVISSPRVMTLNGETAKISQGTQIPYQTTSDEGTTTEFEDAELSLEVTPLINPDSSVILEITASNSTVGNTVSTGAGSAPAIDTKEAETKLLLHDGETTVIGGIYVKNTIDSEAGTPFVKNIPLVGHLFKSSNRTRERNELMIFVTPHIVSYEARR